MSLYIPEFGFLALVAALFSALTAAIFPSLSKRFSLILCGLVNFAFGILIYCYIVSDFSVLNVATNSHTAKPLIYKISGSWGNHEGSMLLWMWMLSLFTALFGWKSSLDSSLKIPALRIQNIICLGFLAFILLTSNPFERIFPAPENGSGLNPLLQDIGLALHPPLLYAGYVGFSLSFSAALAFLLSPIPAEIWARKLKPWVMISWSILTLGIAMGSWWAYRELGWGGFWFWDPVENASLMPWLAGTALAHSLLMTEKRRALTRWTVLLAIMAFSFSLLGTFLVRSGVLTSVHAFANDPERGLFILLFLFLVIGSSLTVFALRAPQLGKAVSFAPLSREMALLVNNLLILTACGTVLLGTLYPLILELLTEERVSVGPPYFNATFNWLAIPLLFLAFIGVSLKWKKDSLHRIAQHMLFPGFCLAFTLVIFGLKTPLLVTLGIAFSGWLAVGMIYTLLIRSHFFRRFTKLPLSFHGMIVSHLGLALLTLSIAVVSQWQQESEEVMTKGSTQTLAGYTITLENVDLVAGPNYISRMGFFTVTHPDRSQLHLTPESRFYPIEQNTTTESAIDSSLWRDIYIAMGETDGKGHYAVRMYYKPLINGIWLGAFLMALGGIIAILGKRKTHHA